MAMRDNANINPIEGRTPSRKNAFKKSISPRPGNGSSSSMTELLECPVCTNIMYPPIHQCCNGHAICFTCKVKVNYVCPVCRQGLGNIRCLALEKISEMLDLPCKFNLFGCREIFSYHNRVEHEMICNFRRYNCPYNLADCSVTGDIESLVAHLMEAHQVDTVDLTDGSNFNNVYEISDPDDIENDMWLFTLFNNFGHQFYIQFEAFILGNTPVFMAFVRFMGEENEAKKFRCSLEVSGRERKLTWQGIPRSIRESDTIIRDSLDGLIIQKNQANFFSGDRENVEIRVSARIWKVEDM